MGCIKRQAILPRAVNDKIRSTDDAIRHSRQGENSTPKIGEGTARGNQNSETRFLAQKAGFSGRKGTMVYALILIGFGVIPLFALWFFARQWIAHYAGVLVWLALMIVFVGPAWESIAIDRVWFYAPSTIIGARLLNIPIEEWAYYVLDALLAATLAVLLMRVFTTQGVRKNV